MDRELYRRVSEIVGEVCDLEPDAQQRRVAELCAGDPILLREVTSLLAMEDVCARGSSGALATGQGASAALQARDGPVPEHVGSYRIVRPLGIGGMGVVYEAEQQSPRRRVALKLLRLSTASAESVRRFRQEAEALGRLRHPAVAQIFESGDAEAGRGCEPYIAMELVDGRPLDEAASALELRARLELFVQICEGVEAAHAVGVIHRDLKPANILVDARGAPKILDFGVARLVGGESQTLLTRAGGLIGTVAYMSPEQVGDGEIDDRTDVHALGVILFELIADRLPLDLADASLPEAIRRVRESEPLTLRSVSTRFRGDLDTIVAKAMARESVRRYQTVRALREDVGRYLRDEPITARPASGAYRAKKFVRRHRPLVGAAAAVFLVLSGAVVVVSLLLVRSERLRRSAERALERSEALSGFVVDDMFGAIERRGLGYDARLIDVLDDAAARLPERFADDAEIEGLLQDQAGWLYRRLGKLDRAREQYERSISLLRATVGPNAQETLKTEGELAGTLRELSILSEAEAIVRDALQRAERAFGDNHKLTVSLRAQLGQVLSAQYRHDEAIDLLERVIGAMRSAPPDDPMVMGANSAYAGALLAAGRTEDSIPVLQGLVDMHRARPDLSAADLSAALNNLGNALVKLERFEEAVPVIREAIEAMDGAYPPDHWFRALARFTLAYVLAKLHEYEESDALCTESMGIIERSMGPAFWVRHRIWGLRIGNAVDRGLLDQAVADSDAQFAEMLATVDAGEGFPNPGDAFTARRRVAGALCNAGRAAEAEAMLRKADQLGDERFPDASVMRAELKITLAVCLGTMGRLDEAGAILEAAMDAAPDEAKIPAQIDEARRSLGL